MRHDHVAATPLNAPDKIVVVAQCSDEFARMTSKQRAGPFCVRPRKQWRRHLIERDGELISTRDIKVLNADGQATLPEYFRELRGDWIAIPSTQVPSETGLTTATFTPKARNSAATLNSTTWNSSVWASPMMTATLNDGSTVDYVWYRFVDQPAIARLGLASDVLQTLQAFVTSLHQQSGVNGVTIAGPTAGRLATLDPGLIVTPPAGLTFGYVPVVIRQR